MDLLSETVGVDLDGDGKADIEVPLAPVDPDHEPFALVDLFMSPHRPLVPVWVNNVVSITTYACALALFLLILHQTGNETYRETEIRQSIMGDGDDATRTSKRDVECNCLSKLTDVVEVTDPLLGADYNWRVVTDIALPNSGRCEVFYGVASRALLETAY